MNRIYVCPYDTLPSLLTHQLYLLSYFPYLLIICICMSIYLFGDMITLQECSSLLDNKVILGIGIEKE